MPHRFHRAERLKSRTEINRLFAKGARHANSYPIRAHYVVAQTARGPHPAQAAFVVPKRRFKRATDRNLIKRRMREAYRLHKDILAPARDQQLALILMYTGREIMEYVYIEKKVKRILHQIANA